MKQKQPQLSPNRQPHFSLLGKSMFWIKPKKASNSSSGGDYARRHDSSVQRKNPLISPDGRASTQPVGFPPDRGIGSACIPTNDIFNYNHERYSISTPLESPLRAGILLQLSEAVSAISDVVEQLKVSDVPSLYTLSSWFLHDCYRYLVQREVESMHYVTGIQLGSVFTLDKIVTFTMSHQSVISARGDVDSTHRVLIEMESYGHRLHAYFHSHPGNGELAVRPSSVDLDYQDRLERGGYPAIGGIFSRDGYFRAYSLAIPFRIAIYGKGVQRINERTYRLIKDS